jgi:hypothetical protein
MRLIAAPVKQAIDFPPAGGEHQRETQREETS